MNNQPIGVIDSGVGGLTILKRLIQEFPNESFIYYGDTKNAPYGQKDISTLKHLTEQMIRFMEEKNVKALIIACNTITASGVLKEIKTTIPHIIEIIEPTVVSAINTSSSEYVVLATEVTIRSNLYQTLLEKYDPKAKIETHAVPELVLLAEKGELQSREAEEVMKDLAPSITSHTTVILGCTHYPFFTGFFKKYLTHSILIDSSHAVVKELQTLFAQRNLWAEKRMGNEYHVSGEKRILKHILSCHLDCEI